jgi:hypothetical protein
VLRELGAFDSDEDPTGENLGAPTQAKRA